VASGSRLATALKGKCYTLAIMPEKDKLNNYLYRPRAPTIERWFFTITGYSPDQDAQRHAGVKGKEYTQSQLRHMEEYMYSRTLVDRRSSPTIILPLPSDSPAVLLSKLDTFIDTVSSDRSSQGKHQEYIDLFPLETAPTSFGANKWVAYIGNGWIFCEGVAGIFRREGEYKSLGEGGANGVVFEGVEEVSAGY
jgi:hypothetical protein